MFEAEWDEHDFELDRPGFEAGVVEQLIFDSPDTEWPLRDIVWSLSVTCSSFPSRQEILPTPPILLKTGRSF